jgi:hypothetical protein
MVRGDYNPILDSPWRDPNSSFVLKNLGSCRLFDEKLVQRSSKLKLASARIEISMRLLRCLQDTPLVFLCQNSRCLFTVALFLCAWSAYASVHWAAPTTGVDFSVGGTFLTMENTLLVTSFYTSAILSIALCSKLLSEVSTCTHDVTQHGHRLSTSELRVGSLLGGLATVLRPPRVLAIPIWSSFEGQEQIFYQIDRT